MTTVREPRLEPVAILDLRPTQITVGMREVKAKRKHWRDESRKKGEEFLGKHMIPVILASRVEPSSVLRFTMSAKPIGRCISDSAALAGPARVWESRTFYLATRHASRGKDKMAALISDVSTECERRGLPRPIEVEILEFAGVANGGGLRSRARLRFATAIQGPLLLGRDSHQGGGVFCYLDRDGGAEA